MNRQPHLFARRVCTQTARSRTSDHSHAAPDARRHAVDSMPPGVAAERHDLCASPAPASPLLTEREAARVLAVSPRTLWSLRADGQIPHLRIGRSVRYVPADLLEWIEQRKEQCDPER